VRTADDRRVVLSYDVIPESLLRTPERRFSLAQIEQILIREQSIYTFLKRQLATEIHHAIAWLRPVIAERSVATKLHVPVKSALLYVEQVDYGLDGGPLLLSDEYHVAEAFTFTVYRTS
jgi:GntR family transcriptional regulator